MIRSLVGLLFILIGVALFMTAVNDDPSVIRSHASREYGGYIGGALMLAGFVIGKFWSLKWEPKRRAAPPSAPRREERVEEQIDLFEPRNKA